MGCMLRRAPLDAFPVRQQLLERVANRSFRMPNVRDKSNIFKTNFESLLRSISRRFFFHNFLTDQEQENILVLEEYVGKNGIDKEAKTRIAILTSEIANQIYEKFNRLLQRVPTNISKEILIRLNTDNENNNDRNIKEIVRLFQNSLN